MVTILKRRKRGLLKVRGLAQGYRQGCCEDTVPAGLKVSAGRTRTGGTSPGDSQLIPSLGLLHDPSGRNFLGWRGPRVALPPQAGFQAPCWLLRHAGLEAQESRASPDQVQGACCVSDSAGLGWAWECALLAGPKDAHAAAPGSHQEPLGSSPYARCPPPLEMPSRFILQRWQSWTQQCSGQSSHLVYPLDTVHF